MKEFEDQFNELQGDMISSSFFYLINDKYVGK